MHPGTAQLIHIQCHQPVGNKTQHLGQNLMIGGLGKKRLQRGGF